MGGGDGGADILCERGRHRWVCAVYFPPTPQEFADINDKFTSDLTKAIAHCRNGFIFATNQRLTRGQRQSLVTEAIAVDHEAEIYDVERLRNVLDSAEGYGLRASYLQIAMSLEDQIAFFASRENQLVDFMSEQADHMATILKHLNNLRSAQEFAARTMAVVAKVHNINIEPPRSLDPLAVGEINSDESEKLFIRSLAPDTIRLVHRLVCFDLPTRMLGRLRTQDVFITKASVASSDPTVSPPSPADLPRLMDELCKKWRAGIATAATRELKIASIAEFFHGLLFVHPFLDGNGRVARSILMQQCVECFGHADMSRLARGAEYYTALQQADQKEFGPLNTLIESVVAD